MPPRGDTGGQKVAPGRSLPIEHLPRGEGARIRGQHQRIVQFASLDAPRDGDRLIHRARSDQPQRARLDPGRNGRRVAQRSRLPQQGQLDRRQTCRLAQMVAHRLLAARFGNRLFQRRPIPTGGQIEGGIRRVAQQGGHRVDQAALHARLADDEFALSSRVAMDQRHILDRRAEKPRHMRRPVHVEPHVGRTKGRNGQPPHPFNPQPVRAEPRPRGTAHRQHAGPWSDRHNPAWRVEPMGAVILPQPAPAHHDIDGGEPGQPSPQQG